MTKDDVDSRSIPGPVLSFATPRTSTITRSKSFCADAILSTVVWKSIYLEVHSSGCRVPQLVKK
jgi:hypothetical protein